MDEPQEPSRFTDGFTVTDAEADAVTERGDGPPTARSVALDMARRGVYVVPVAVCLGAAFWGTSGALSVAYGLAIVAVNVLLAASTLHRAARTSVAFMGTAVSFGFLVRLGVILCAVTLVRDTSWVHLVALGLTIIVGHLVLLVWETWSVARCLAGHGFQASGSRVRLVRSGPQADDQDR